MSCRTVASFRLDQTTRTSTIATNVIVTHTTTRLPPGSTGAAPLPLPKPRQGRSRTGDGPRRGLALRVLMATPVALRRIEAGEDASALRLRTLHALPVGVIRAGRRGVALRVLQPRERLAAVVARRAPRTSCGAPAGASCPLPRAARGRRRRRWRCGCGCRCGRRGGRERGGGGGAGSRRRERLAARAVVAAAADADAAPAVVVVVVFVLRWGRLGLDVGEGCDASGC